MYLAIWCNNNLNILIVVIMMRMTWTSLCNFKKMLTWKDMRHLSSWRKERVPQWRYENGATATFRFRKLDWDIGAKKVTGACHARMVGWSRIPSSHMSVAGKRGAMCTDSSDSRQNKGASHTTCIRFWTVVSAVIPLKRAFSRRFEFRVEVDVLAM